MHRPTADSGFANPRRWASPTRVRRIADSVKLVQPTEVLASLEWHALCKLLAVTGGEQNRELVAPHAFAKGSPAGQIVPIWSLGRAIILVGQPRIADDRAPGDTA